MVSYLFEEDNNDISLGDMEFSDMENLLIVKKLIVL